MYSVRRTQDEDKLRTYDSIRCTLPPPAAWRFRLYEIVNALQTWSSPRPPCTRQGNSADLLAQGLDWARPSPCQIVIWTPRSESRSCPFKAEMDVCDTSCHAGIGTIPHAVQYLMCVLRTP